MNVEQAGKSFIQPVKVC